MRRNTTCRALLLSGFLLAVIGLPASALDIDPILFLDDARSQALGGLHVALADDFSTCFSNPAGLAVAKPSFSAARLDLSVSGPIFEIANVLLSDPANIFSGVSTLLANYGYKFYTGADLYGPIAIGYLGDGLGFGIFQHTSLVVDVASVYSVQATLAEDVAIVGGYAFRLELGHRNALDVGILAKGFVRASTGFNCGVLDLEGFKNDYSLLLAQPFSLTTGIGIDAGLRWNWAEIISFGLNCRDLYSPAFLQTYTSFADFIADPVASKDGEALPTLIPRKLTAGLALKPPLGILERYFDGFTLAVDYEDILDLLNALPRNPVLNVGIGMEVRILDVLSLRIGIREALLHAGIDFDLKAVHVSLSAWGNELGLEPGERTVYNMLLGLDFIY